MSYRIKSVAALTGLTTSTLRAWERRYGLLAPERTRGGYRVYTEEDVERLVRIKSLLDGGFKVSEAIALVERAAPTPGAIEANDEYLATLRSELRDALLRMDRPAASLVADRLRFLTFEQRIDSVLLPLMREIGELWACEEANVAQEHFASAFVREKLSGMLQELDFGPATGVEAVCAGSPGDLHELGLMAAAVHLALHGWRVTYFGVDLPFEDLALALQARPPALLCTSIVQRRTADECREIVSRLREIVPAGTTLVLGGLGIPEELVDKPQERVHVMRELSELVGSSLIEPASR